MRRAAAERGDGVLLDGERVEAGAEAVRLGAPLVGGGELPRKVRLPEGDVKDPPDPVHHHEARTLCPQAGDLLGVAG